mmetsp:Transcript_101278/g.292886  ORF Transcript_101278/g.292886 Transcript_101278/m.292886 type:complete len:159 (+) Transcript_101278:177-653(+)
MPAAESCSTSCAEGNVPATAEVTTVGSAMDGGAAAADCAKPAEVKGVTLARALQQKENRAVARTLFAFAAAMAIVPVVGLLLCERLLRGVVEDSANRWTWSGGVAVALVNAVAVAYVIWCFFEESPRSEKGNAAADCAGASSNASCGPEPTLEAKKHR